jgi:outer membrane protein assembly factor BamB
VASRALDWPQFRGPNGDGTTTERVRTDWKTKAPRQIWKVPVTDGFSSIAVGQGKVLTLVERSVGGQAQEVCIALDGESGRELWARPLGKAQYDSGADPGDGPRCTPTIRGDRVYVFTAWMVVACLDLNDGHVIWSKDLIAVYGGQNINWQNAASPLVEGDRVIVNCNAPNKTLLALSAVDGSKVWQSATDDRMTHATPVPTTLFGTRQVVFHAQRWLVSVNPTNGTVLWRLSASYNGTSAAASPVIGSNLVYISANYGTGARVVRVDKSGSAFTPTQIVRKSNELENHWSTPVHFAGYIYGCYGSYGDAAADAPLECYRMDTLEPRWSKSGFGHAGGLIAQDKLVMLTETGQLVLIDPNPTAYTELGRFQAVNGKCWNVPALADGRLYARSIRELAVYDVSLPPPPPVRLQPSLVSGGSQLELRLAPADGTAMDPTRTNTLRVMASPDPASPLATWSQLTGTWTWEGGVLKFRTPLGTEPRRSVITLEP